MNTALALKADTTDLNSLTTTVNTKANQSSLDTLTTTVNTKANQSSLDALTTTVNSKANTTDLDAKADVSSVYTQNEIATLLAGKVDTTSTLIQSENNEMIIPQRAIPYPPKNISIPAGNYGGADDSPTVWAYPFNVVFPSQK